MGTEMGRVKLNSATMSSILGGGMGMDSILAADANRIAAQARALAPVDTGAYRDSIRVQAVTRSERRGKRRVYQVIAGGGPVDYARQVEAANSVMAKALGASIGRKGRR